MKRLFSASFHLTTIFDPVRHEDDLMIIATERLTIRRINAADWESIKRIWDDQKSSAYSRFDKPNDTNDAAVRKRIEKWASYESSMEHLFFAVCLNEILIGYAAFNRRDGGYEIGYCFHSGYHGKGYAKESISAIISTLKNIQPEVIITARTALENKPSVKLLQSLGFRQTGTEQISFYRDSDGQAVYFDGGIFNTNL